MSGHVPAPWAIVERAVFEDGSVYPRHVIGGPDSLLVCYLEAEAIAEMAVKEPGSFPSALGFKAANARLIAAAPELLEAVRITIGNVKSIGPAGALGDVPYAPYTEWLRMLEQALAKATQP